MRLRHCLFLPGIALLVLLAAGCSGNNENIVQGWVEADLVFVGPDEAGRVETLSVQEGDTVAKGAPLFTVDDDLQQAEVNAGEAALANADQALARAEALLKSRTGTQAAFDQAQAVQRQAEAQLRSARTKLARRKLVNPVAGTVQQVYYRPGELVPAGRPVVSLLPPGNLKVRFYVSETVLPKISYGDEVEVKCDGCAPDLKATVRFISRSSEYTPPVIYSQEERSKLVFLIEARPEKPGALRVGQPVSVALPDKAAAQ